MDPGFFNDDYVYDTYDSIIDENDDSFSKEDNFEYSNEEHERDIFGDWTTMGAAFALAEELADELRGPEDYEVDENTDRENMVQATSLLAAQSNKRLRPFEQYIDDIIRGDRSLFEEG